ncbi:MAG: EamA family transporter RarD [SAR324 cluster bacterium]|nr:EamA family transporter RarD [SAR324 cluster bacterium]
MINFFRSQSLDKQIGALYALLTYGSWGLLPIYWKLLYTASALEILAHRMLWSMVFVFGLLAVQKRLNEILELFKSPKNIWLLLLTAFLLGCNWFVYIYAVNTDQLIEASLGYYINPLLNVLMGFIFLRERLNFLQSMALCLAALGVLNFLWDFGSLPWIALSLSFTFALYGLVRKVIPVKPLVGLLIETVLLAPLAIIMISIWMIDGYGSFGKQWETDLLLIGAGVVTSLPLLWFVNAAKRLRYTTMGFFQYLSPSLNLVLGIFLYNEPFTQAHIITFSLIWSGLAIFSINTFNEHQHA